MVKDSDDRIEKGEILARAVLEVAGAPKEHVEKSVELLVDHMKKQDYIEITSEEIYEAEEKDKLFTSFAEVEFWAKGIAELIGFEFDFMPSSIEILEPEEHRLKAHQLSGLLNDVFIKLHSIHMRVKNLGAANQVLQKNSEVLLNNFLTYMLRNNKDMTAEDLSKALGVPAEQLKGYLANLEKGKIIKKNNDTYQLIEKNKKKEKK